MARYGRRRDRDAAAAPPSPRRRRRAAAAAMRRGPQARAHSTPEGKCVICSKVTPTSPAQPQQVILEFFDYHGPVTVLAGDYMPPPAQGQPRPGMGMPEVAASTAFSRRGCTPWFPSPADHAGEIYISFHEHGPFPDPEAAWQERIAAHFVPLPGRHVYPPSTTGQYDLRLRSQLMLPPAGTVFLLVPVAPVTPGDMRCARDTRLHRLVSSLQLLSHAYIGFVSLPEAIFHANHTVRYPASVRAVRRDPGSMRFRDLSTVDSCSSHDIDGHSSACRYAVSLGLVVYYPYGHMGTSHFVPPPNELSTTDIVVPTPGWLPPDPPAPGSPAKDAHTLAREWAESLLMTDLLVAHASRWMMTFHDSFLNKLTAISTLRMARPDLLFLAHQTRTTHRPRFARNRPRHGVAFATAAQALRYATRQTDVQYIYMLPAARCGVVDVLALRVPPSAACADGLAMGAVLIDVASLPAEHGISHVPPLCISAMRPLALDDADPMRVHVLVDGTPLTIHTMCDAAEWMGQATPTHHGHAARPLQVVCDASLQKQVHPHLLRMYLDQTAPTVNPTPPRERWPCSQNRILLARTACTQSAGSLIWVFMFQPLSNRERFSHRRWVLASLTYIAGEQKWQLRYQSLAVGAQRAIVYRPHMANAPLPPVAPMDDTYTYDWPHPLDAVWFPATTPLDGLCSPPPCLNPVTHVIDVMRRARTARACSIPRLWKDLLAYHALSANVAGRGTPVIDILDVFSQFDDDSFPCTLPDPIYGGIGSKFVILERAMAFDHALTSDAFPGTSNHDTMDCPCVTNGDDAAPPCSMSTPGFVPRVWSRVASDLPNFAHDSWIATDSSAWESDPQPQSDRPFSWVLSLGTKNKNMGGAKKSSVAAEFGCWLRAAVARWAF